MVTYRLQLFPNQKAEDAISPTSVLPRGDWQKARVALDRATARDRCIADRHRAPASEYQVGQRVRLAARALLQVDSRTVAPPYIGCYPITPGAFSLSF